MTVKAWWYDGSAWRETVNLWVWDGSTWQSVKNLWVWDGAVWRLTFTSGDITGLNGFDSSGDPGIGNLQVRWTDVPDTSAFTLDIDADFYGGTSYADNVVTGFTPVSQGYYDAVLGAFGGFSSLNSTNIRARLMDGATIVKELTMAGPY